MKSKILNALTGIILFLTPYMASGQTAPILGTAANFVLFTTNGSMTNAGTMYLTLLTGNVGSNLAGTCTGFGNVNGVMHDYDTASAQCATDVLSLETQLTAATPTFYPASPVLGNGDTLLAGVYQYPLLTAASLNLNLVLNAQGNPNAIFIFQIDGAFSTNALSKVKLINGALACNVFWNVQGAVNMSTGTKMRGTIVANGLIDMTSGLDTLEGRALSINGAVSVSELVAYTPIGCGSLLLTGPIAPALDSAGTYGVFSSIGGVTSTPVTYVIGNVGSNSTTTTGFNPLNVTGTIETPPNVSTAACDTALTNVYNYLVAMPADIDLLDPSDFGHGLILTPHSYQITGITTFTGNVYLDAEGDANAVFVIKINGAFTTGTNSNVILTNGTQAKNVYWKIDGAVDIYPNSLFNGTIVAAGAITLNTGDTLNGRALTINGAVAINGSYVDIPPIQCIAPDISGTQHLCPGGSTILTDSTTGGTWSSSNTTVATIDSASGMLTGITPGTSSIQYMTTAGCVNTDTITVNSAPNAIIGLDSVCVSASITLSDSTSGGTWNSSNSLLATVGTGSGIVTGVAAGTPTITYSLSTGCITTKTITVNPLPNAGSISSDSSVCVGASITLTDTTTGGVWSSSNAKATVIGGVVTGVSSGIDTIRYVVTGICGADTAIKIITVSPSPNADSITGILTVCPGATTTLSDIAGGGVWSSVTTATATIGSSTGIVSGVALGTTTISYTVTNSCGTAAATTIVTVSSTPNAGSITGILTVCPGATTTLSDIAGGGVWSSVTTATATIGSSTGIVSGVALGATTISYTVTNSCGTAAATTIVTVSSTPNAGSITGILTVCPGATTTLSDIAGGGVWSSVTTATATIGSSTGIVSGVALGTTTISYAVTNSCGTAAATTIVTVSSTPNAGSITGILTVCPGATTTLSDIAGGGVWSSVTTATATIGSSTGIVSGVALGTTTISYTVTNSCGTAAATTIVTVSSTPNAGSITGILTVCPGATTTLSDIAGGGVWSSVTTATATIGSSTGIVSGVALGTTTISYTVTNSCGTAAATTIVTVSSTPNAGSITGILTVCPGATTTLSDIAGGGVWSSVTTATAAIGSSTGIVFGVATGTTTISYTVTNSCGTVAATTVVTVNSLPNAGSITGASGVCIGSSITLTDATTGGVWSISNTFAAISGGIITGVAAGLDTISYAITNACGTATVTKTVIVNQLPLVPAIATQAPSSACTGTMYQNYGAATLPPAGITYNWTAINATVWAQGIFNQYALISFTETGIAYVTLNATISATGCTIPNMITVNVGATVAQTPYVSYFNNHFVCTPANEDTYQWGYDNIITLDSTILIGEINQDYINESPDFTNNYYWAMTTNGDCLQKTYYIIPPAAIQNVSTDAVSVSIYPNPANSFINVDVTAVVNGPVKVEVFNMMGQKLNTTLTLDNKATIDVTALSPGSYLITCYRDGVKIAGKTFIKN